MRDESRSHKLRARVCAWRVKSLECGVWGREAERTHSIGLGKHAVSGASRHMQISLSTI